MRAMLRDDLTLTLALARDAVPVIADRPQLERVLLNLVLNSRDATVGMPDGEVRIETPLGVARRAGSQPDRRDEIPAGEYAVLVVRDNGRGMTAECARRAFEPFFTTKRSDEALGLGLSTAYGIVKQSGGFIWLESEPGSGTSVTVYLPAARRAPADSAAGHLVRGTEHDDLKRNGAAGGGRRFRTDHGGPDSPAEGIYRIGGERRWRTPSRRYRSTAARSI